MTYRPITDMWLLARPKVKYYGAYPNGFLERARILIGCPVGKKLLHVCSGKVNEYPNKGFGLNDKTLDIDESLNPDFVMDAENEFPIGDWDGVLIDPPYTVEDAKNYNIKGLPNPNLILKNCLNNVGVGCKVGMLHYICPSCPKNAKFVCCVGVLVGFNNRIRIFSVYEQIS